MSHQVDEVPLLERMVATLQNRGRIVRADRDLQTVEISGDGDGEPTVAVVLPHAQRVVFYSVRPRPVPTERIPAVSELAHRLNTDLHTACWELDVDSGMLSVRSGFEFDSVATLTADQKSSIIWNCLLEVEICAQDQGPAVTAVVDGVLPLDAIRALAD